MDAERLYILEMLRATPFLAQVPTADLASLASHAARVAFASRDVLCRQGEPADAFFIVISGHVILYIDGDDDPSHVARICAPGESFGEWCVCCSEACRVTARAFGPAEVIAIPGDALASVFAASPELALGLIDELSVRLRTLIRQLMDLKMKTAAQRLGSYLLQLTPEGNGACEVRLPFEKKLLARFLGMQPETLSRVLLKLQGIGVRYNRSVDAFRIPDIGALRKFCDEASPDQMRSEDHAAEC
jgi:CRP/FNR family transcriptional activator FtrB